MVTNDEIKKADFQNFIVRHRNIIILIIGIIIGMALFRIWQLGDATIKCQHEGGVYVPSMGCLQKDKLPLCQDRAGNIAFDPSMAPTINLSLDKAGG